jgi:urease accessory protein
VIVIQELPPHVHAHGHAHADSEGLRGKTRDTLVATSEERRWVRRKTMTVAGREIALALPTGTVLEPGALLFVGDDWYLELEAAPEAVIAVYPRDHKDALRTAFEVGNRHFSLALDGERLLVPDDTAMEQLLTRLGVRWEKAVAVFRPIGKGHSHDK